MSDTRGTTRRYEFRVGLLIVAGLVATVWLVLMSDKVSFDSYYQVNGYLEGAAGLRSGSHVELAGIHVGSVVSIKAVDDKRGQIRVTMSINSRYDLYPSNDLSLATKGILGDTYLAFSGSDEEVKGEPLAKDGSAWVIAVPGFFDEIKRQGEQIVSGIRDLLDDDTRQNSKALIRESARFMANLADASEQFDTTIEQTNATLLSTHKLSEELRGHAQTLVGESVSLIDQTESTMLTVQKSVGNFDSNSMSFLAEGRVALEKINAQLANGGDVAASMAAIRETTEAFARLVRQVEMGRGVIGQLLVNDALSKDLNNAAINVNQLTENVARHPEIMIWGQTDEQAADDRLKRRQRQDRRAFANGYENARHDDLKDLRFPKKSF